MSYPSLIGNQRENIKGFASLRELALDLLWSWSHRTDQIWHTLDPTLWELTHNPWIVLQTVSLEKLKQALSNPEFSKLVEDLLQDKHLTIDQPAWFQQNYLQSPLTTVAYFSMEYMLSEALPIYSGGLGNVAGDQLKSASDLGVPVVAVGLLYQRGYFHQIIDANGEQQALYPINDPGQLPILPLRKSNGEWLRIEIMLPGWSVWLRTWQVIVGRVRLYLLDSNDPANYPPHRGITSELYGGDTELRLKQELILGIGGWKLLQALNIKPEVCHLNEGHAAFAILERANSFMKETGEPFEIALTTTKAGNLFTTHTAVSAGFDLFSPSLIKQYCTRYAQDQLGISIEEFLALGRKNPNDPNEAFNMAYLAIRGSGAINGVSQLHEKVSREIFQQLFPRWPQDEVPVGYVTNGVHMPSWDSAAADRLWTEACGKTRWLGETEKLEKHIESISDAKIVKMRNEARKSLVEYSRKYLKRWLQARGAPDNEIERVDTLLHPNRLTLGFARRFATYKRPNLLLHNPERFLRILTNPKRPVQLLLAGKAHPADRPGQQMIKEWMEFIKLPQVQPYVVFLNDYDMLLTEHLVQGVDVWINTPRRPWEACGTSGMKVLVNGGLNLSVLDGWWAEAYTPEVGWALGSEKEESDEATAESLYNLLENVIIPEFYHRNKEGISPTWIERIRQSMAKLTPHYSANRAVREYTEKYYLPAASNYLTRAKSHESLGKEIVHWQHALKEKWDKIRFVNTHSMTIGDFYHFDIEIYLGTLDPEAIEVELYADSINSSFPIKQTMVCGKPLPDKPGSFIYHGAVPADRPINNYTSRITPYKKFAAIPLEASEIIWQK